MYWAVHEGNFEFVEVMIRTLFDFNTLRFRGVNVLHQAAKNGDIEIIKLILKFAEEKKINALSNKTVTLVYTPENLPGVPTSFGQELSIKTSKSQKWRKNREILFTF